MMIGDRHARLIIRRDRRTLSAGQSPKPNSPHVSNPEHVQKWHENKSQITKSQPFFPPTAYFVCVRKRSPSPCVFLQRLGRCVKNLGIATVREILESPTQPRWEHFPMNTVCPRHCRRRSAVDVAVAGRGQR